MAISAVTSKALGYTLWLHFQSGFTSLVNNDDKDFSSLEAIIDSSGAASRGIRYALEPSRPVSNVQNVNPGAEVALINGESDDIVEKEALPKQVLAVAEFDYNVYERANQDPSQVYVGPMGMSLYNQMVSAKEHILAQYYGDGSGALATIGATPGFSVSSGVLTMTISNLSSDLGCIYWLREGQKVVFYTTGGVAHDSDGTSPAYYKITGIDFANKTISVVAYNSSDVALTLTTENTIAAGDVLYNYADETNGGVFNRSSISDYGGLLYMPGLQSLAASDGRTVHSTVMSNGYAGTNVAKSSASLMFTDFGQGFALAHRRVGEGKYDYPLIKASYDTWRHLIDLDEGSKFLRPMENERGGKSYMYSYNDISAEVVGRRFVPDYEMWAEPKLKDSMAAPGVSREAPLMFKFTGFDFVKEPETNNIFRFKINSSGQRVQKAQCHLQTYGTFVCSQAAGVIRWSGFTIN